MAVWDLNFPSPVSGERQPLMHLWYAYSYLFLMLSNRTSPFFKTLSPSLAVGIICTSQSVAFQHSQISRSWRLRLLKINICKYTIEISCGPLSLCSRNSFTMRSSWPLFPARASRILTCFFSSEVMDVLFTLMVDASLCNLMRFGF